MYTQTVGRKKKTIDELMVNLNAKVDPEFFEAVEQIAIQLDRRVSYVGRKLLARGLAAYKRDGLLDEPSSLIPVAFENLPIIDGSDAPTRNEELPESIGIILPM